MRASSEVLHDARRRQRSAAFGAKVDHGREGGGIWALFGRPWDVDLAHQPRLAEHTFDQVAQQRRGTPRWGYRTGRGTCRAHRGRKQRRQFRLGQPGNFRQPPPKKRRQHRRIERGQQRPGGCDERGTAFCRLRGRAPGELGEQKVRQWDRRVDQGLECGLPATPHGVVGIFAVGQEQKLRLLAVSQDGQRIFQRAPRRATTRIVTVEAEDDHVGDPEELLGVDRRRRGTQRRHGVFDTVLRKRHHVHVALDDHDPAGSADCRTRLKQAIELAALGEQWRFRRVEVLGLALTEYPAAETHDVPAGVMDREHDAVAKSIVALAAVADDNQARGFQRLVLIVGERALERLPVIRCIADAEASGDRAGQAALLEVIDRARSVLEYPAIELGGLEQYPGEILRLFAPAVVGRGDGPGHLQADVAGELLDRVRKRPPAILHQEADCSPVRPAPEAVVELLARADGE